MSGFFVIVGLLVFIVAIYIGSYYLNANTAVPEGVEPASCESCNSLSCPSTGKKRLPDKENCEIEILN